MDNELYILWTNDNPITAELMVFMYAHNAVKKGWWEKVTIIVWGATSELTAADENIQARIREMTADGVRFIACKACADKLGATEALTKLGIEVFYTGETLTQIIKQKKNLLTV